jgi:DNA-binding MarR family transcriptional regulator
VAANLSGELAANWLGALAVAVVDAQREAIADAGSASRAAAMLTLRELPGIAVGELALVLGLTHSACVRVVDGLVADRLVARTRADRDSRQVQLTLTATGRTTADRLQRARLRSLERLLGLLPEAQRTQFARHMQALLSGVTNARLTARRTCRFCAHRICTGPDCPIGSSVHDDGY